MFSSNRNDIKVIRSKRKTLALFIQSDATILVKAPFFTPMFIINRFIDQNGDWIIKKTSQMQGRPKITKKQYQNNETFLYLGHEYRLTIGNYPKISIVENKLHFPKFLEFNIQKELQKWYMHQARTIVTQQVVYYGAEMKANYMNISFSDTKSKWGSCTHDNRLQFNWRLIMAPILTINYVVVHELSHTIEKNHSRSFWNRVRFFSSSYRQQRNWLKEHGDLLFT